VKVDVMNNMGKMGADIMAGTHCEIRQKNQQTSEMMMKVLMKATRS
jgi:hypothetical protein